jgi:hypothetical protein
MLIFIFKTMIRWVTQASQFLFYSEQWNIGVINYAIDKYIFDSPDSAPIQWAPTPSANRFIADPFGNTDGASLTILCEEFYDSSNKGIISAAAFTNESGFTKFTPIISEAFHLSYPYLLLHKSEIFCIPESFQAREIALYKAAEFPTKWQKYSTLIYNVAAVDPTIFEYEGLWWLMHTDEDQGSNVNLYAWYAHDILGSWEPHQSNPVKTDVRSSRPAGTPFMYNGNLYRPAQDCSTTYGRRVALNRVLQLTPKFFEEEFVKYIEPDRRGLFTAGLHTISSAGNFTIIDGKRFIFKPSHALTRLVSHFKKIKAKIH